MEQESLKKKNWHDKHYKLLLLIPLILMVISIIYMVGFYAQTGTFIRKDISLKGGTSITIYDSIDLEKLEQDLLDKLEEINLRKISDVVTQEQKAVIIETTSDGELTKQVLEEYLGYELTDENSSFEFTGSTLSKSFFNQLLIAIIVAFIFMAIVVFILFRSLVPSTAVIISAFADILMTLALINLLGIKLSSAGIVALLMLIGYSVDTDILLTNRLLKRHEGSINSRLLGAFKTGMTMTFTSLLAFVFALENKTGIL